MTWSCFNRCSPKHCGICGKCVARLEAFKSLDMRDPAKYWTMTEMIDKIGCDIAIAPELEELHAYHGLIR